MTKKEYKEIRDREKKLFFKTCPAGQKPVLSILRVHLLTEYYLERIIAIKLPRGDRLLEDGGLSYAQKIALVDSFSIVEDSLIAALRGLNKVRNRFSHEFNKAIDASDIDVVGRPFGVEYTKIKREYGQNLREMLHFVLITIGARLAGWTNHLEEIAVKDAKAEKKTKRTGTVEPTSIAEINGGGKSIGPKRSEKTSP